MSYYNQQQTPVTAYPPPGQGYPPPPGYPANFDVAMNPPQPQVATAQTQSRGDKAFLEGCCAALCCCCLIDTCF